MRGISDASLGDLAQRSRSQEGVKGHLHRFFEVTLNLSGESWRAESYYL